MNKPFDNRKKIVWKGNTGVAAIEFAIMLPIFVIFVMGVVEFGYFFVRDEIADRTISSISLLLQRNPTFFDVPPSQINALVASYGSGMIKFSPESSSTGNYICVDAYKTQSQAQNAPACTSTHFLADNPNGGASTTPYYIAVRATLKKNTITPLVNFVSAASNIQVNKTSGAVAVGYMVLPTCGPGQGLQFTGTGFICVDLTPPNCDEPWQKLEYISGAFQCVDVPYIITGGDAGLFSGPGGASGPYQWVDDSNFTGTHDDWTLCHNNISFTVPAGLPAGQIIAEGNLFYPASNGPAGQGTWHAWSISFKKLNTPMGGGTATTDLCAATGGNYESLHWEVIGAEHLAWTATYIPNSANGR